MKKIRILAALTAVLCCFQNGLIGSDGVNVSAVAVTEEYKTYLDVYDQFWAYVSTIECKDYVRYGWDFDDETQTGTITIDWYHAEKDAAMESLELIKNYCEEQGWLDLNYIEFNLLMPEGDEYEDELYRTKEKVREYIDLLTREAQSYRELWTYYEYDGTGKDGCIVVTVTEFVHNLDLALEQLNAVRTYCEEQGFTDLYQFEFIDTPPKYEYTTELEWETETEIQFISGDVNSDREVDILDVILLNKAILGKTTLSDIQNTVADINQDNKVDAVDSLMILKQIVGINE